jgi:hypothetical protein
MARRWGTGPKYWPARLGSTASATVVTFHVSCLRKCASAGRFTTGANSNDSACARTWSANRGERKQQTSPRRRLSVALAGATSLATLRGAAGCVLHARRVVYQPWGCRRTEQTWPWLEAVAARLERPLESLPRATGCSPRPKKDSGAGASNKAGLLCGCRVLPSFCPTRKIPPCLYSVRSGGRRTIVSSSLTICADALTNSVRESRHYRTKHKTNFFQGGQSEGPAQAGAFLRHP